MLEVERNRRLIMGFYQLLSGVPKTEETINAFSDDPLLLKHVLFLEKLLPSYNIIIDEVTAEANRVVVMGRQKGTRSRQTADNSDPDKTIEVHFAIGFKINNNRIVDHWQISDQLGLLEQLGLFKEQLIRNKTKPTKAEDLSKTQVDS